MIPPSCRPMALLAIHPSSSLTAQEPQVLHHDDLVQHLVYLQGDKQLLGACSKFACVWDTQTGREVRRFPKLNRNTCAATSPDGKTVAIAENGPGIFLYDTASGKELRKITVDNGWGAVVVAWSSDGRWLAAGSGKPTIVWEAATGKEVHRLIGDDASLVVAFAPSGKVLVSGGRETIQL